MKKILKIVSLKSPKSLENLECVWNILNVPTLLKIFVLVFCVYLKCRAINNLMCVMLRRS